MRPAKSNKFAVKFPKLRITNFNGAIQRECGSAQRLLILSGHNRHSLLLRPRCIKAHADLRRTDPMRTTVLNRLSVFPTGSGRCFSMQHLLPGHVLLYFSTTFTLSPSQRISTILPLRARRPVTLPRFQLEGRAGRIFSDPSGAVCSSISPMPAQAPKLPSI